MPDVLHEEVEFFGSVHKIIVQFIILIDENIFFDYKVRMYISLLLLVVLLCY